MSIYYTYKVQYIDILYSTRYTKSVCGDSIIKTDDLQTKQKR